MKFRAVRRINLANLDEKRFGYEHEEFEVSEAETMEEATTILDQWVTQRIAFYRGLMAATQGSVKTSAPPPASPPPPPANLPPGVSTQPPKEFD